MKSLSENVVYRENVQSETLVSYQLQQFSRITQELWPLIDEYFTS